MSEDAYSRFVTTCPVTMTVEKEVWSEDSNAGTFDNGQPLRGPSPVDMCQTVIHLQQSTHTTGKQ